ncbi:pyridoxamine 5'-phosphate oxidase family protein [Ponticoccus alexandrii]|uniref:Pyridoxamine 5'-phosphate oxidase family protein n=1 Tax=Ponticoccus alexandrii TaxID=1943633 RepID=A0ABX7F981_9RHOB|nr:pyridoxamine 5'-phosphate oxidase family protein [Ponticoccus alexandrii]ETA52931.1 pyridoxamine 5'-phosphate oxidase [Rhodobacteraceae bacterium PD-2]QRF66827.1 pyridoxamine 5'-phosphate oxidase family protein [Ponticoccus alexandrii]
MAKQFPALTEDHRSFIAAQPLFFVGSAADTGRVNVSPKGMDSLRVMGPNRILWRNLTGSGNETAGHLARVNRITLMWCSFETRPLILRAYGSATVLHAQEPGFAEQDALFPPDPGARQVYDVAVDLVQTSCGYAVPFMDFVEDRRVLEGWAEKKGPDGVRAYWAEKNTATIDGFDTRLPADAD